MYGATPEGASSSRQLELHSWTDVARPTLHVIYLSHSPTSEVYLNYLVLSASSPALSGLRYLSLDTISCMSYRFKRAHVYRRPRAVTKTQRLSPWKRTNSSTWRFLREFNRNSKLWLKCVSVLQPSARQTFRI